ncbi:MAG: spore germination protein [Actinomycetia bacterium]|nr:spore germination protein [Actinomycetes bacterium]
MTGPVEPIGRGQFFLLVAISVVAGGVYIWPQAVLAAAGQNAVWSLVGSVALAGATTWAHGLWGEWAGGPHYLAAAERTWGWARWGPFAVTVALCLAVESAFVALFAQMLHVLFYVATPLVVLRLLIILLAGWFASKPLNGLARNVQFWFPLVIFSFLFLWVAGMFQARDWPAALPSNVVSLVDIARGILMTWYLWIQGAVLVTLAPHVSDTPARRVRRIAVAAILAQGVILLMIYVLVTATLGPEAAQHLEWPLIFVVSNLNFSSAFISRPGVFILLGWVAALILHVSVHLYCGATNLAAAFGGHGDQEGRRRLLVAAFALVLAVASSVYTSPSETTDWVLKVVDPWALGWCLLILPASLAVMWWRRRVRPAA